MYDSVQLVQNSAALNGTQRVLLDHVISEEECADLRHLAHVRTLHHVNKTRTLNHRTINIIMYSRFTLGYTF